MQPIILFISAFLMSTPVLAQSQSSTRSPLPAEAAPAVSAPVGETASGSSASVPTGTSTSSTSRSLMDDLYFTFFTNFKGPNLSNLGSAETVNAIGNTNPKQRMYFDTDVMAAYKIGSTYGLGVSVPFWLITTKGQEFSIGDVGIRFYERRLVNTKDLTIGTNVTLQAPTNEFTKLSGMDFGVKVSPAIRYNIPFSRFTLGAWTEAKAYVGVNKGKSFKLWGAPYISYQIAPKLSGILQYEHEGNHLKGKSALDFTTVQSDIVTGLSYMVAPNLIVNPYVAFYTTEKISMDHSMLGAIITASI